MFNRNKKKGFTLIELMIVVAIIAVISAIAIPNLMESRKQANHASAHKSLQTIHTAQEMYRRKFDEYAAAFQDLYSDDAHLIQADLEAADSSGTAKSGYYFGSDDDFSDQEFVVAAGPANPGSSGDFNYFINNEGTVYKDDCDDSATGAANLSTALSDLSSWDPEGDGWSPAN